MNEETKNALRAAFAAGAYELARVIVDESGYKFQCWHELWTFMPTTSIRGAYPEKAKVDAAFETHTFTAGDVFHPWEYPKLRCTYSDTHKTECPYFSAAYARMNLG